MYSLIEALTLHTMCESVPLRYFPFQFLVLLARPFLLPQFYIFPSPFFYLLKMEGEMSRRNTLLIGSTGGKYSWWTIIEEKKSFPFIFFINIFGLKTNLEAFHQSLVKNLCLFLQKPTSVQKPIICYFPATNYKHPVVVKEESYLRNDLSSCTRVLLLEFERPVIIWFTLKSSSQWTFFIRILRRSIWYDTFNYIKPSFISNHKEHQLDNLR